MTVRSAKSGAKSGAKPTTTPHLFTRDPDVPPDQNGVGACSVCHCMGAPGDARHTLPAAPVDGRAIPGGVTWENGSAGKGALTPIPGLRQHPFAQTNRKEPWPS